MKYRVSRVFAIKDYTKQGLSGRLFEVSSIQGVPREIRCLVMKHITDIDIKHAHPVILVHFCKLYGYIM